MEQGKKVPPKKAYSSPTLWVHGGIGELTKTAAMGGTVSDTRGGGMDFRTS